MQAIDALQSSIGELQATRDSKIAVETERLKAVRKQEKKEEAKRVRAVAKADRAKAREQKKQDKQSKKAGKGKTGKKQDGNTAEGSVENKTLKMSERKKSKTSGAQHR